MITMNATKSIRPSQPSCDTVASQTTHSMSRSRYQIACNGTLRSFGIRIFPYKKSDDPLISGTALSSCDLLLLEGVLSIRISAICGIQRFKLSAEYCELLEDYLKRVINVLMRRAMPSAEGRGRGRRRWSFLWSRTHPTHGRSLFPSHQFSSSLFAFTPKTVIFHLGAVTDGRHYSRSRRGGWRDFRISTITESHGTLEVPRRTDTAGCPTQPSHGRGGSRCWRGKQRGGTS
jgi:hypothetical protein